MLKKIISSILIVAFLAGILMVANPYFVNEASAEEYRGGFLLTPASTDSTGVKPDSSYTLKAQRTVSLEELKKLLSIDGEPAPGIAQKSSDTFEITPARPFEPNKLYTFRLKADQEDEITWTFQTSAPFKIASVFPANQTTGVPTNSGIEIYFSHEDYEDIDQYFEISPAVQGTFERHKRAAVFVPKELKAGTLYTVKIKKGLKLKNTAYALNDDYTFMFETGAEGSKATPDYKGYFSFNKSLNEYSPREKPYIPFYYYINQENTKGNIKVQTAVYGYNSLDAFIEALNKKDAVPTWAAFSYRQNMIEPDGLNKAVEFQQEFNRIPDGNQFIVIPQALPAGYYLVDSKWDDIRFQTFIQVTDVGMYIMKSDTKTLVWLNDLAAKKPIEGASIALIGDSAQYVSDAKGIAYFDTPLSKQDSENGENRFTEKKYFKITTKDNKTAILNYYSYFNPYYGGSGTGSYWNYLYLDRNLYKPDDTISFWGLAKNRYSDEKINSLTIEIGQGYRVYGRFIKDGGRPIHFLPTDEQPLVKQTINAENGIFKGTLKLPSLEPGGYQFTVKTGDTVISSSFISVENYTKPPYNVQITKDKEAVSLGQQVNFNLQAAFFEGTGVPNLRVDYSLNNSTGTPTVSGNNTTDSTGKMAITTTAQATADAQGEHQLYMNAHAALPEIGEISQNSNVRLFVNDINAAITGEYKNNKGKVSATVNKIALDRLNNGTAKDSTDFLGDPVNGKILTGTIYLNTWVKIEDGQYYDFINKVTQKRYRYEPKKDVLKTFSMTTGSDGKASFEFDAPKVENGYYSATVNTVDNSGRNMKFDTYIGEYYDFYSNDYQDNRYFLDGGKESYNIGDTADLTFKKGKQALENGSFLFIKTQNGIREYSVLDNSRYSFTVSEKDVPNTYVTGVYFNGITYIESEQFNAVFNYKEKNLVLDAQTDKASYKPGDEVIIKINAKDKSGTPQKAVVNISLVDEALFNLSEQQIDTLASLYSSVPPGIAFSYQSHVNSGNEMVGMGGMATASELKADGNHKLSLSFSEAIAPTATMYDDKEKSLKNSAADFSTRQDFRDTAHFETITLDDKGYGELKFKLPDNVTSWRITLSGVTTDLLAGSNKVKMNVTLPFFINYTLNTTYLAGDKPVLGVNAYGSDLKQGDAVTFEVSSTQHPDRVARAEGKAFERVNIPLWALEEGRDDIIIKASASSGLTDAVKHTVNTVKTYHEMYKAAYYNLTPGLSVEGGSTGSTRLIFSDRSRGIFLPDLMGLLYTSGNRIDQKLSVRTAAALIQKYFNQTDIDNTDSGFKVSSYQREDGGIALLPYGNSDIDVSAKLVSLIKDEVDAQRLKQYFYSILYDETPGLKGNALYGLAVLKEPVLLNLDKAADVQNADIKDLIYIALAYCELGETPKAGKLFDEKILPHIEEYKPYLRVNTGKDNDDILECTSLASFLAAKLDRTQKKGLYDYCTANWTKDLLINIEKLLYISTEIEKYSETPAKFTYSLYGEKHTMTLSNGRSLTLNIPSQNLSQFKIDSVEGDASVASVFKQPMTGAGKVDNSLSVKREYYTMSGTKTNTFKQNDIVKVELTWDFGAKALDGGYEITDYLPSGLKPIENSTQMGVQPDNNICIFYRNMDGQKVTFYVYKGWDEKKPLVYYARVISPGTYTADGTVIQSISSKDSINIGDSAMVTIE